MGKDCVPLKFARALHRAEMGERQVNDDAKIVCAGTRHVVYKLRCLVNFQLGEIRNCAELGEDVLGFLAPSCGGMIGP